jgi:hypothetical protein
MKRLLLLSSLAAGLLALAGCFSGCTLLGKAVCAMAGTSDMSGAKSPPPDSDAFEDVGEQLIKDAPR